MYFLEIRYFAERFCLLRRFRLESRSRCFEPGQLLSGGTHLNPITKSYKYNPYLSLPFTTVCNFWEKRESQQRWFLLVFFLLSSWISSSKRFQIIRSLSSKLITATRASHLYRFQNNPVISDSWFCFTEFLSKILNPSFRFCFNGSVYSIFRKVFIVLLQFWF